MTTISKEQFRASKEELMNLERRLYQMFQSGDVDQAMSFLMKEAIVCPPDTERVVGREKQTEMFKELLNMDGFELFWEPSEVYVGPSNDMAYVYGLVEWKMPNEDKKKGKYISIWVKNDGKWMNIVEIRNTN